MAKRILWTLLVLALVLDLSLAGWLVWADGLPSFSEVKAWLGIAQGEAAREVVASGVVEAREVKLAAEIGGKVLRVLADEGEQVAQGALLLELDSSLIDAQIAQAEAGLALAQAKMAQVEEGARPEELRRAEAILAKAIASREGALQTLSDTLRARDNPQELDAQVDAAGSRLKVAEVGVAQSKRTWEDMLALRRKPQELDLQITSARAQVEVARHQVEQATAQAKAAQRQKDILGAFPASPDYDQAVHRWWAAEEALNSLRAQLAGAEKSLESLLAIRQNPLQLNAQVNEAEARYQLSQAERDGAAKALENLQAMRANPQALDAQVNAARAQYEVAKTSVQEAQAALDLLRAGASIREREGVLAQVRQAEAALEVLKVQKGKLRLLSPLDGLVSNRAVEEGESVLPGGMVFTLSELDEVTLTIFVPEDELGLVRMGQTALVTVDSYPGKDFVGRVSFISPQAEFTPRNVQSRKERVNMVFAVKIALANPDYALKPGMPADATLRAEG